MIDVWIIKSNDNFTKDANQSNNDDSEMWICLYKMRIKVSLFRVPIHTSQYQFISIHAGDMLVWYLLSMNIWMSFLDYFNYKQRVKPLSISVTSHRLHKLFVIIIIFIQLRLLFYNQTKVVVPVHLIFYVLFFKCPALTRKTHKKLILHS